jgi:serine/threonine-protein kinase
MSSVNCPQCHDPIRREDDSCPSCGADLRFTVTDETGGPGEPPTGRLEFAPGQTFAERYTVIERIGAGGMGIVYKAIDTALDSVVVLKLIQPGLAENPSFVERFRREARITRQITHPNICRLHDIGESQGILYLSMEWIEGETLQQLLRQTGMLREGRALEITSKITLALEAAHQQGIIHRDLKPANVMIGRRGTVHVLDFGLALEEGQQQLTGVGVAVGTPFYMSPEQRGGGVVDLRTDLYALGLILLEMLTGRRTVADPALPDNLPPEVNPLLTPLLKRLLAWRADDRFQSTAVAREEIDALRENPAISAVVSTVVPEPAQPKGRRGKWLWPTAGASAVLVAVAAYLAIRPPWRPPEPKLDPAAQGFYAQGERYLRDEFDLEGFDQAINMFQRARNVQPDSALIMARLSEAFWRRFERRTDSTASRDEAERWLAQAERIDPDLPEVRHARALGFILEGRFEAARGELERALDDRPKLAMAWVDLASVYWETDEYAAAEKALDRATELEPENFRMQIHRGLFHDHFQEYDEAAKYYREATQLKPDSAVAWNNVGTSLFYGGRYAESIPPFLRSLELEENAETRSNLGTAYFMEEQYEEAVKHYRRATETEQTPAVVWGNYGDGLMKLGQSEEAADAYRRAAEIAREKALRQPLKPDVLMELAQYCALAGDESCALEHAASAVALQPDNALLLVKCARIQCVVGRNDDALDWLDRAVRLGASRGQIEAYPEFAVLRDHPRFQTLLELID